MRPCRWFWQLCKICGRIHTKHTHCVLHTPSPLTSSSLSSVVTTISTSTTTRTTTSSPCHMNTKQTHSWSADIIVTIISSTNVNIQKSYYCAQSLCWTRLGVKTCLIMTIVVVMAMIMMKMILAMMMRRVILTMLHSAQSLCWTRLGVKTYPLRPSALFSRAWVKVMSLIKEIDEILTCSNIDHGGYNGYDDDLKQLSRFDDDVCDERCMLCKGSGQDQGIWDCQKIDLLAVYSCIEKS